MVSVFQLLISFAFKKPCWTDSPSDTANHVKNCWYFVASLVQLDVVGNNASEAICCTFYHTFKGTAAYKHHNALPSLNFTLCKIALTYENGQWRKHIKCFHCIFQTLQKKCTKDSLAMSMKSFVHFF